MMVIVDEMTKADGPTRPLVVPGSKAVTEIVALLPANSDGSNVIVSAVEGNWFAKMIAPRSDNVAGSMLVLSASVLTTNCCGNRTSKDPTVAATTDLGAGESVSNTVLSL